nr:hypothetical protein [Klebsiella pneumoniae]
MQFYFLSERQEAAEIDF